MHNWAPFLDPANDPPPPDDARTSTYGPTTVIDAEVVEDWFTAADSREYRVFEEMEHVIRSLEQKGWKLRAKHIRRDLALIRKEAAEMGFDWGREVTCQPRRRRIWGRARGE